MMDFSLFLVLLPGAIVTSMQSTRGTTLKTVLITGCSSGYGLETARYFHSQGWNVVATMRTPSEDVLPRSERLRVVALDVTQPDKLKMSDDLGAPIPDDGGSSNWLPNCMTDYSASACGPNR